VSTWPPHHPVALAGRELAGSIAGDATVSAHHSLTAHLARRREVYAFPNPFVRNLYGSDVFAGGDRLPQADTVRFVLLPRTLNQNEESVWDGEAGRFDLVTTNEWWALYERR
jgi:hypothetical protein